jgi:hypothetical protein
VLYCTHSHINLLILLVTCSSHDKVATGARVGSINVQRRLLPHPLSPSHGVSHLTRACCATGNTTGGVQRKHLARFVGHESHPEGSTVLPGATLTKTWIVRNDARVPWPPGNVQVSCPSSLGCKCQAAGDGLSLEFPRLPKPRARALAARQRAGELPLLSRVQVPGSGRRAFTGVPSPPETPLRISSRRKGRRTAPIADNLSPQRA